MPRILIIGGGAAGLAVAQTLAKHLTAQDNTEVVILEKNNYYYHAIGAPRGYVDANFSKKLFIPYDNAIPKAASSFIKIVRGVAARIISETNEVHYAPVGDDDDVLAGPVKSLEFDYLVIATGSKYTTPIRPQWGNLKKSAAEAKLHEVSEQIKKANSVLIVGGGPVGIEVAGEIKAKYPKKTVTIIEAREKLVAGSNLRDKFRSKLARYLKRLDIKVITGERLETRLTGNSFVKQTLRTDKGTRIESDIQLLCAGSNPIGDLVERLDKSLVTVEGAIKVNDKLQLDDKRFHHVFVVGDASNHPTPKLGYWAGEQGKHLGEELARVVTKAQSNVTKPFPKVEVEVLVLPLGPNGGVSQLPVLGGLVGGNLITRSIKSKDYFTDKVWSTLGAKVPN